MRPILRGVLCGLLLGNAAAAGSETIHLIPEDRASWRFSNLFAWLRPNHNFGERTLRIETTPPGATLDLFYIRANFQKRYEQVEAPVLVVLPRRVEAGPRDAISVRAYLEGYRQGEKTIRISSKQEHMLFDLDPLPNTLVAASHTYFAGRTSLAFLTRESLTVRVQNLERGFNVVLAETGKGRDVGDSLDGIRSPWIQSVESHQLGEDLLVRVRTPKPLGEAGLELRSRQSREDLRDLHVYSVDLVPSDGGAEAVRRARAALKRITSEDVSGCALRFDAALREALEPAALARALAPRGAFTDPYLRAAMKRLGEVSPGGRIEMRDGTRFDSGRPLELAAALSQAAEAKGLLALLRALSRNLEGTEHADQALRSLVAPESGPTRFAEALAQAQAAERSCR